MPENRTGMEQANMLIDNGIEIVRVLYGARDIDAIFDDAADER